ncbi:SafA/ExsA family spore coat assembly protein [Halobacillus salinus]|nr:SafA/ExsA family spore coat assembly protein [Halobacillus salinus]
MKFWMWLGVVLFSVVLFVQSPQMIHAQTTDTYTVKSGDTLWKISKKYQIGLSEIINANPQFSNPDLIYPGDRVTIPLKPNIKSVEQQVIDLTNQERAKQGLSPLKGNWQLSRVARYKSRDMRDKGYFSHQSPTYGSPFEMMRSFNVSYRRAAENIAAGQRTPQEVVDGWMNSPGHRKNILDPNLRQIGVGYAKGGSYGHYWTQMFISQ